MVVHVHVHVHTCSIHTYTHVLIIYKILHGICSLHVYTWNASAYTALYDYEHACTRTCTYLHLISTKTHSNSQNNQVIREHKQKPFIHMHLLWCRQVHVHVKLSNSLNDGNTVNQHQCQVIIKDPEKLWIQLGCEPRTLWLLHVHEYQFMSLPLNQ